MNGASLPRDHEERANFDQQDVFILGDPAACFDRSCGHNYDRKSDNPHAGYPGWKNIFTYILRKCGYLADYDTVYVMVDTRNLADHTARDPGLPHWQAAVAWWESRLQMIGPMGERTELCFFPASEDTGLHNVHPTWAGTFVLAALGASFPGKHFFLLDSDCLPVTLFEAFDLWQEAYLTRFPLGAEESSKMPHPLLQHQRFQHDCYVRDTREGTSHQKMGQGVVFVTEPHAELNAGFVGLFASGHSAIFNWAQWNAETKNLNEGEFEAKCAQTADFLTSAYWALVSQYLCRRLSFHELSPDASKAWIQTGLALSPLFGTVAQHSIDVIIAWALIGEWSCRVLFPPPDGPWPRHGHPQCIGEFYVQRAPSLTAWARACFEQGALASLLYLPGIVPVFTLPGDRMFQSTGIHTNVQRPVILHAYGGAKVHMESALQTLRLQGWIPMASALVGTDARPPLWVTNDLRVTAGTSIDLTLRPHPLTQKEDLLLLSLWRRHCQVPKGCALGTWLRGTNKELGPDNDESPHKLASPLNVAHPATADNVRSTVGLEFLGKLPSSIPVGRCVGTELRLLIAAFEIENMDLGVLVSVLLAGVIPDNFPIDIWHGVVWITLASSASYILRDEAEWQIAYALLADVRTTMAIVTNRHGDTVYERQTGLLNKNMIYPLKVVLSDPKRTNWPSRKCTLDATGLGGNDLPSLTKADITVRTDKHKQNIYGPSMTTVESVTKCHIFGKTATTALGISKAAHEFLVLHYFATDSIIYWNSFIHEVMPLLPLPVPAVRRAEVVELLQRIHIAPSHRRMPHHTWKDALSLVMDLLFGSGKRRYFSMARVWQRASRVNIKGFSAGSYVGLALVHVLREIKSVRTRSVLGAIACPPSFLKVPSELHTVHLIHYVPDRLCRWNPGQPFLDTLRCKYTIVKGHFDLHQHHFGKDEHNYSHWLGLRLEEGTFSLPHLMMRYDDAALSQRRDAAPLRLISWLTFGLPYWLQDLVEALMTYYGNRDPEATGKLNSYLVTHYPDCPSVELPDAMRDHII